MQRILLVILLAIASCRSKEKPEQKPTILSLKEMGDLATVEYTVTKIIKANDNKTWFKMGDRKILMSCEATIKAGIDMSAINPKSFTINDKNIEVVLPQPKIISISIPPEKIKLEYENVAVFRDKFSSAERDVFASQAETQIKNSAEALGILEQAKANTSLFVSNFLKKLGYENVSISYQSLQPIP